MANFYSRILFYVFIFSLVPSANLFAQFGVQGGKSATDLVKELVGNDVQFSNVRYNGAPDNGVAQWGTGTFTEPDARLDGIKEGIFLFTADRKWLNRAPNTDRDICAEDQNNVHHTTTDQDIRALLPNSTVFNDGAILEFDFIAKGDSVSFNYVFGSDEYPDYVCSEFNDVFGFFLSGPGINGPYSNNAINIAQIPNKDLPVAINTVNVGVVGDGAGLCGGTGVPTNANQYCYQSTGLQNSQYFTNNLTNPVMNDMQMNGFTKKFVATKGGLKCGKKYHIKLAISDVADAKYNSTVFLESGSFKVTGAVIADASVELKNIGCAPHLLETTNNTDVPVHIWDFGDNTTSNEKEPTHIYTTPGKYKVTYIAIDEEKCIPSDTLEWDIEVLPPREFDPKLVADIKSGCDALDSLVVELEVTSEVDIVIWDMGDGTTKTGNPVKHVYQDEGEYVITVTVKDTICGRDSVLTETIKYDGIARLKALISAEDTIGCGNYDINLTNNSINTPNTVHVWDFGNGDGSRDFEPNYQYQTPGTYNITYIIEDPDYCIPRDTAELTVVILNAFPFEANLLEPEVPRCVLVDTIELEFEVEGTAFDEIIWDFGDGSDKVYDETKVTHVYDGYKTYRGEVLLRDTACDVDSLITFVIPFKEPSRAVASIDVADSVIGCEPFLAEFINNSNTTEHLWIFGDGDSSRVENPNHTYKEPGKYIIIYQGVNPDLCIPEDADTIEVRVYRTKPFEGDFEFKKPDPCESTDYDLKIEVKYTGESTDKVVYHFDDGTDKVILLGDSVYNVVKHVYKKEGKYELKIDAFDEFCGLDTTMKVEFVFERKPDVEKITTPNIFTPNGDGINDEFRMFYSDYPDLDIYNDFLQYEVTIFNRWGNKLYETGLIELYKNQQEKHWTGNNKSGDLLADGIYFYLVKFKVRCGDEENIDLMPTYHRNGHVQIQR